MANGEDKKDASARLLATAALFGGTGAALYKGFQESPGSLERVVNAVRGVGRDHSVPAMMVTSPIQETSRLLSSAFRASEDVMAPGGMQELLRRSYERALYGAGVVADQDRGRVVAELVGASQNWEMAQGAITKYEGQLGGFEGIHDAIREIAGGTLRGNRNKEIGQLIRELPSIGPDGYPRSDFEPSGRFWSDRFNLKVSKTIEEIPTSGLSGKNSQSLSRILASSMGGKYNVESGIRQSNRDRLFQSGRQGDFSFSTALGTDISLPYSEVKLAKGQRESSRWFLQTPRAIEHRGINFVAADHRGMSYASVPHFAIPTGTGYKKVPWNKAMHIMLRGSEDGSIEGLAQKLQKLHGDEKAMRDLTWNWNTQIRGLFHRVTGTQSNMTQAYMHSESILPLDRFMQQVAGEEVDSSIEGLTKFYSKLKDSGMTVGPLAGADPMAEQYRVGLQDWAKRWDVFGEGYAIERKYAGRVKPFSMTSESIEAMGKMPIGGVLSRGHGITATAAARAEMNVMPQAVGYLTLGRARHFKEEEAVISKRLAPMMKMQQIQKYEVLSGTTQGNVGEVLREGVPIGVDYRTGESIYAKGGQGLVEQKIISARQIGDIVDLRVQSELPLQDQIKIFGYKAQIQVARGGGVPKELVNEWGAGKSALRFQDDIDFIGHAGLMKNLPQEVNKQMAEAQWLIMQKRLSEAGVLRSGGRSKIERQRIRSARGQKTYTWKGGLPKDYINMDMFMYVRDQKYRDQVLRNRQKGGARLAKRLGLKGEQEALGAGLELMRYAKKHGLDEKELSLIGGAFYQQLETAAGGSQGAAKLLKEVGLTTGDVKGLEEAKGVLAMPTMHVGGYASFDNKWGRAGMDYRALMEIKAQRWGKAGEGLIGEIARRVIPAQDLIEMERAALSVAGRTGELPDEIEKITSIREAQEALGKKSFLFDYGGKEVYVPGGAVKGMGQRAIEPGEIINEELRGAYQKYFSAHKSVRDYPGDRSVQRLEEATSNLEIKVHKNWAAAGSLRGKVVGTAGPVARSRLPKDTAATIAKKFASAEEFIGDQKQAFRVGLTKETGSRMFSDLMSKATGSEKAFLKAQQKAFLAGEKVTGVTWRHPTHRPQSLMPTWFELVEGKGESAQFHRLELQHGDRVLDLSQAAGMKLDYDFDHVQVGLIADEKVKVSIDQLLNSRRYREQFIEGVTIQADIMERVKSAAASGAANKNVESYVAGLQRLVGVKLQTGQISNLVGDMRAAAAFQASGREFTIASYLFAELEEGPISSKHGLGASDIGAQLKAFVKGEGTGVRDALGEAWDKLFEEGTFTAANVQYEKENFIDKASMWVSASEEDGNLSAYRNVARRGAQAQKGKEWDRLTMDGLSKAIDQFQGGRGDLNASLAREMRMGPGSGITKSRQIAEAARDVAGTVMRSLKKHWKLPAIGAAAAVGISALAGGGMKMKDQNQQVTSLGQGPDVPHITTPSMTPNRIVSSGGGSMPVGYGMHGNRDYSALGLRQIASFAQEVGSSVRIRDDRGAITPEYIEKASRERYY